MGDIRASLYDLFGYLIPGLLGGFGLWLLMWSLAWPAATLSMAPAEDPIVAIFILALTYAIGHVIQAVGNLLHGLDGLDLKQALTLTSHDTHVAKNGVLSKAVLTAVNEALQARYSATFQEFSPEERFALIDESRVLADREGDREVYIYHHGFYRGLLVAALLLILGISSRIFVARSCMLVGGAEYCAGRLELMLALIVVTGSAMAFRARLRRFARYRLVRAVMLWLTIEWHEKRTPSGE